MMEKEKSKSKISAGDFTSKKDENIEELLVNANEAQQNVDSNLEAITSMNTVEE